MYEECSTYECRKRRIYVPTRLSAKTPPRAFVLSALHLALIPRTIKMATPRPSSSSSSSSEPSIRYRPYVPTDLDTVVSLVHSELSEPYVVYTYRYFLDQWYELPLSTASMRALIHEQAPSVPHRSFLPCVSHIQITHPRAGRSYPACSAHSRNTYWCYCVQAV